ncbi:MAG: CHAT domain-containing protein [Blastocatellales bacterium]
MILWLISHRAIDHRLILMGEQLLAGRRLPFFRPLIMAVLSLLLLPPIICLSQTLNSTAIADEDALLSTIQKLSQNQKSELRQLLNDHRNLLTPRFWKKLMRQASLAYHSADAEKAIQLYDVAIEVAQVLNDKKRLGAAWYNKGMAYSGSGKPQAAIQAYTAAKQFFEEAGAQRDLIYILSDLGTLYLYSEDYKQAKDYSEQCLKLAESLKNSSVEKGAWPDEYGVASALSTLGMLSQRDGNYSQAIDYLDRSLALYQELDKGNLKFGFYIADNLSALGRVHKATGENNRALNYYNQALNLSKKLSLRDIEANALNDLGVLYLEQEDYEKAEDHLHQSLKIRQARNNLTESARVLLNLGVSSQRRGDGERALGYFGKSLDQATAVSNKDVMIAAGEGIGAVYREQRRFPEALEILDRSLVLAKEIDDQTRIAEILWREAEVFYEMGDYDRTVELAESALKLARKLRFTNLAYVSATTLGRAFIRQKKADLAFQTLTQAIDQVETMRFRVAGREEERQLYFENKVASYHALIDLLIEQKRPLDALLFAEQAKSRALLDVMSFGRIELPKTISQSEKDEEQRLNQRIVELNNQMVAERLKRSPEESRLKHLAAQLDDARLKYAAFQNLLYASSPQSAFQRGQLRPLTLADLDGLALDSKAVFLEFVVTQEKVYLFILTRKDLQQRPDVTVHSIPVKRVDLAERVERFHRLMAERRSGFGALSRELYDLLIKPAELQIRGKTSLCIIPDGLLWELSFQSLQPREEHYLIEDFAIFQAPSLSVLKEIKSRKGVSAGSVPSLLALGNPIVGTETVAPLQDQKYGDRFSPLPDAEIEVKTLARFFQPDRSRILVGDHADELTFKSLAHNYSVIHCATHGMFDNRHPLYSFLLLAKAKDTTNDDGLLEAREILNLKLSADLAVLSACETARGRIGTGEGVIGLSWAFFAAGCRSTLVTLWKVNSAGTSEWMTSFYHNFTSKAEQSQSSKAKAARLATLKMLKERQHSHPFYWAGFILIGSSE